MTAAGYGHDMDLFGLGVPAMIAFLSPLFRRFGATHPVWIECDELQRRLTADDQVLLLDIRQPDEFTSPPGHLAGAVNVPLVNRRGRMTRHRRRTLTRLG
jgi:hypothetical protein